MTAASDEDVRTLLIPGRCDIRDYGVVSAAGPDGSVVSEDASEPLVQDGRIRVEAVSRTWSKWGLTIAYMSVFLMAFVVSLEGQVTYSLAAFAVSSFNNHSLLSTVYVVQSVVNAVIKPPMAKLADVFGRLEAFCVSVLLCVLGYIQMAASQNVETYASAQIFYAAGSTGLQILQQIFIADTSSFLDRALFSSLPDSPFLVTVWIGPAIAAAILAATSWRVGYAMWAVILPAAFLPLAMSLFVNGRKAEQLGLAVKARPRNSNAKGESLTAAAKRLFHDLDLGGTLLLSGGLALILVPLTLVSRSPSGWHDRKLLATMLTGGVLLILFPLWESLPNLAPHPLLPLTLLKSRTFCAGCALGFFYFAVFYIAVQPYFYSYLLVALNLPVSRAGPITQTFSFASTIAALLASLVIRHLAVPRPRPFIIAGAVLYTVAIAVLLRTRTRTASVATLFAAQTALGAGAGLMHVATQLAVQAAAASITTTTSSSTNHHPSITHPHRRTDQQQHHHHSQHHHQQQHVGIATASFLTLVQVGAAVGSALSGAVWGALVPRKLHAYLPPSALPDADKIYASVVVACGYDWGSPEREAIARAYQETVTVLLWIALGVCVPVVGMAWAVDGGRLDTLGGVVTAMGRERGAGGRVGVWEEEVVEEEEGGDRGGEDEGWGGRRGGGMDDGTWWSRWWGQSSKGRGGGGGGGVVVSVLSVHSEA